MLVIGLTGGLATGKTTVAKIFNSLGAVVIDADNIAREVVKPKSVVWQKLRDYFGTKILNDDLTINRKVLADLIFNNETYRTKLNEITHPVIIQRIKEEIESTRDDQRPKTIDQKQKTESREHGALSIELSAISHQPPAKIVIINAPLLIEAKMNSMVDKIIVVTASETTQIKRVMERDNLSKEAVENRIAAQMPLSEKVKLADFVIDTDCSKAELKEKVKGVWENLLGTRLDMHDLSE